MIVHAHGTTWSTSLLTELAERGAPVVLCATNHAPKSVLMPLDGHHAQGARMRAGWQAKTPLIKQAWKQVVAAGLNPTIGLFHANRGNAFALADDLMEPFRPLVDCAVRTLVARSGVQVDTNAKQNLARLIAADLPLGDGVLPVSVALMKLATSLGQSFEVGKLSLVLPRPPDELTLAGLGA